MINPVELAQELIRCRSVTPADDGAIELLQAHLQKLGFACEIMEFSEPGYATIKNLYARYGTSSPNICFAGHTDVVPVGDVADWKFDPFSATIEDGVDVTMPKFKYVFA